MNAPFGTKLAAVAYESLRTAILGGGLPPGTPLSRRRLAEELGMSAVPVGDAFGRLEGEGLVESRPRAGTRVRIATAEEIHGNYVLREALETHSARLFAESARPADCERLVRAAERVDMAYNALALARRYSPSRRARVERSHIDFHMLIAKAAGVPVLTNAIERSRVLLFNWVFTATAAFEALPERWHRDLAEVLVNGPADDAARAMRAHVRFRQEEVIARFRALAVEPAASSRMTRGPRRGAARG
ncbi:MAG: GntR family transcriptional regulator [Bryobacteraceae bacterium]